MLLGPRADFYGKHVEFYDETLENTHEGIVVEQNGNLILVEDEWGTSRWLSPCEIRSEL